MVDSANKVDMASKSSGIVVDMSPAAMLHHVSLRDSREEEVVAASAADLPTNLINTPPTTTFRCERCDNFETSSRATLLLHVVQCLSPSPAALRHPKLEEDSSTSASNSVVGSLLGTANNEEQTVAHNSNNNNSIVATMVAAANGSASSSAASSTSSNSSRKVFECDVCNMKFSNGANMRRHKMRHTGVKPYECRVCQKRFFRKDHLAEHFTTHTKTLPYHCPICNRGFQRQIAMRAHFQNEHVGQHDLVKTCPLCSYRAGSMKSLRIHFFNRHGIDLDNPTTGGTSSLLLALETQASQVVAAAAAASFGLNAAAAAAAGTTLKQQQQDKLDNFRAVDNVTPPIHFLTPHVEISTLPDSKAEFYNDNGALNCQKTNKDQHESSIESSASSSSTQELSIECHAKTLPSSTSSTHIVVTTAAAPTMETSPKSHYHENHITPSISLIPIKQEPFTDDMQSREDNMKNCKSSDEYNADENADKDALSNNRMTSLIKVSPLKSLLREDLKRRICAKANNRLTRNSAANFENNNVIMQQQQQQQSQHLNNMTRDSNNSNSMPGNCTPICNGTITSTGQESDATTLLNRKQILICIFCGIEFPDETLYFLHKGCHCESNPWKCNICGEQCNNIYEFNSHLLSKSHQ